MNKNQDFSRNQVNLTLSRSVFDFHPKRLGSCNAGYLVPVFTYTDVLPGDTFLIDFNAIIRSTTPVVPVMDDLYADVAFFWVPNRVVLSRESFSSDSSVKSALRSWKYFLGAQDSLLNMPIPQSEDKRRLPVLRLHEEVSPLGSLWDYQGNALSHPSSSVNAFPINPFFALAYYAVWNDFYRDPNLMEPVTWDVDDNSSEVGYPTLYINKNEYAGITVRDNSVNHLGIACVSPFHGYFGSALPWPQRNAAGIALPLSGNAPLVTLGTDTVDIKRSSGIEPLIDLEAGLNSPVFGLATNGSISSVGTLRAFSFDAGSTANKVGVKATNLGADLSQVTMANINDLRVGFAEQRFYEALARSGNRYDEMMKGIYGVQRAPEDGVEFLGSQRVILNMNQVNATGGGTGAPNVGSTGAFSSTSFSNKFRFKKSATEHGTILCVMAIRPNDTFSQGVPKEYQRKQFFDYYLPQFAHIGEQAIYSSELHLGRMNKDQKPIGDPDAEIFGYQEYAAEYRMLPNKVCGHLRPEQDLGHWTYADQFSDEPPTLLGFMDGRRFVNNVDQTLITSSKTAGFQFIYDFGFNITAIRSMPSNSIPGLIDHH